MCIEKNCNIQPSYNYKNEVNPIYCNKHKKDEMTNIRKKKCIELNCIKQPSCNYKNEKSALYCAEHKKEGMATLYTKLCGINDCIKIALYNNDGEAEPLYCKKHKKENMIDVKTRKKICVEESCDKTASYNFINQKERLYCAKHKKEGMIQLKSKKCIEINCDKQALFNIEGEKKALYCGTHKKENMINIKAKLCIENLCESQSKYNYKDEKTPLYCKKHKKENMICFSYKTCKNDWCDTIVSKKYDGYCMFCYVHIFPDKILSRNYKTKEKNVNEYILNNFKNLDWIIDKKVYDGCSKRRPDILLDLGYQVIIVEIDENQHIDYDSSCENKRIMEISQDLYHRPIIFIRFNPDDYISKENTINSCWAINSFGLCTVKKSKKKEWNERLNSLSTQIKFWIQPENKIEKILEVIHLFYDE